jgi:hypothetical protein
MYSEETLQKGDMVKCLLYKRLTNPSTYILIPENLDVEKIKIAAEIAKTKQVYGKFEIDDDLDDEE